MPLGFDFQRHEFDTEVLHMGFMLGRVGLLWIILRVHYFRQLDSIL
jgi:hypothetical protein